MSARYRLGALAIMLVALGHWTAGAVAASAAKAPRPKNVGGKALIDVPAGFGAFADAAPKRVGTQVKVRASYDATTLTIADASGHGIVGSAPLGGFLPGGTVVVSYRLFVWGRRAADGAVTLWAPAFDEALSLDVTTPDLSCASAPGSSSALASLGDNDIPTGYTPKGVTFVDQDTARPGIQVDEDLFGNRSDLAHGVRFVVTAPSASGHAATIGTSTRGANVVQGGFAFEHVAFAFGTAKGVPTLWTPRLTGHSTALKSAKFAPCVTPADFSSVTVSSTPDDARRASALIGPFGGSVLADAADGTHFELAVPPQALTAPVTISVTPTSIGGIGVIATGSRFSVEFAPSGLVLATPATLFVTPAPGAEPLQADEFAVAWSQQPGVKLRPPTTGADGRIAIPVPHFSGTSVITLRAILLNQAIAAAVAALPGLPASLTAAARTAVIQNTTPTDRAFVDAAFAYLVGTIAPEIAVADQDGPSLAVATHDLANLDALVQQVALSQPVLAMVPSGAPAGATLHDLLEQSLVQIDAKGRALLATYLPPACSGPVADDADWVVISQTIASQLNQLGVSQLAIRSMCIGFAVQVTTPLPATLDSSQTTVPLALQAVRTAPGDAPTPVPASFDLHVTGATFTGGGTTASFTTSDGALAVDLDRSADPSAPQLSVTGTAHITDVFGGYAETIGIDTNFVTIDESTNAAAGITLRFVNPPVNAVLPVDGTTSLCVDATGSSGGPLSQLQLTFALNGPGHLAATTVQADQHGRGCVAYDHAAGPVVPGVLATITVDATDRGATGHDEVTLTPEWADLQLTVTPSSTGVAVPATNSTVGLAPSDTAIVGITVTAGGPTVSDPPHPIGGTIVAVDITAGPGTIVDAAGGSPGATALPVTDAQGQAGVVYDGGGIGGDATLRVSYPGFNASAGVAATVVLRRTTSTVTMSVSGDVARLCALGGFDPFTADTFSSFGTFVISATSDGSGGVAFSGSGTWSGSGTHYLAVPDGQGSCPELDVIESWSFTANVVGISSCADAFQHPAICVNVDGTFTSSRFGSQPYQDTVFVSTVVQNDAQGNPAAFDCNATYSDDPATNYRQYVQTGVVTVR